MEIYLLESNDPDPRYLADFAVVEINYIKKIIRFKTTQ